MDKLWSALDEPWAELRAGRFIDEKVLDALTADSAALDGAQAQKLLLGLLGLRSDQSKRLGSRIQAILPKLESLAAQEGGSGWGPFLAGMVREQRGRGSDPAVTEATRAVSEKLDGGDGEGSKADSKEQAVEADFFPPELLPESASFVDAALLPKGCDCEAIGKQEAGDFTIIRPVSVQVQKKAPGARVGQAGLGKRGRASGDATTGPPLKRSVGTSGAATRLNV